MNNIFRQMQLEFDREEKVLLFFWGFVLGFTFFYGIYWETQSMWMKNTFDFIESKLVNAKEFLSTVSQIVATVVGISIPVSLSLISDHLKEYNDDVVSSFILKERYYISQKRSLLFSILCVILLLFNICNALLLSFVVFLLFRTVYVFFKYIQVVERYSTKTDEVVQEKLRGVIDDII